VRAERAPEFTVRSFVEEVQIDVAQRGKEPVRIVLLERLAVGEPEAEAGTGTEGFSPRTNTANRLPRDATHDVAPARLGMHSAPIASGASRE